MIVKTRTKHERKQRYYFSGLKLEQCIKFNIKKKIKKIINERDNLKVEDEIKVLNDCILKLS